MNLSSPKILIRILFDFFTILLTVILITPFTSFHGDFAQAENFDEASDSGYPYTKTFTISAYYSPLPCQNKYATGSYEGDIYLNGSGVHGADGTDVYPGMIAAPSTYSFGTKMYIPEIGIVAVHDRGGAITSSNGEDGVYDRLDIWMGYGDEGLKRALNWGKRTMDVTVYGLNDSIVEEVALEGYSEAEAMANECSIENPETIIVEEEDNQIYEIPAENIEDILVTLESNLQLGDEGEEVLLLQDELNKLNFYKGEINGIYDELTEHAVFKFQQSQYLVGDSASSGAGIFGPKTRDRLNEIISARNYTKILIVKNTDEQLIVEKAEIEEKKPLLSSELYFGMSGNEVKILQEFLREQGYFKGLLTTNYYGTVTKEAVIEFQIANNIILNSEETGAGRVGPATLKAINELSL